jgi:hypothetical protein
LEDRVLKFRQSFERVLIDKFGGNGIEIIIENQAQEYIYTLPLTVGGDSFEQVKQTLGSIQEFLKGKGFAYDTDYREEGIIRNEYDDFWITSHIINYYPLSVPNISLDEI